MNNLATTSIAGVGTILIVIYFACIFWGTRSKPDLLEAISLLLTSSGMVSAFKLGYVALFEGALFTGALSDQRIPVFVGAFAIMWVSITATWSIYSSHINFDVKVTDKSNA